MKKRNHFVDISKGLAIIMVTVTHYSWESAERLQFYFPYWISMAVPIFMIVTGVMSAASFERKDVDRMEKLNIMSCVECGMCSYVCPSKIEVTDTIKKAKLIYKLRKK
jgi:succinate dehydrogenase/fumarate reductase-like Fe-S protein